MQTILDLYDLAGRNCTTFEAINQAAAELATLSKAQLVDLAAKVSVYVGGMNKARMMAAIVERVKERLYRHERTCYGSEAL